MLTTNTQKQRIARLFDSRLARITSPRGLRTAAILSAAAIILVGVVAGAPQVYKVSDGVTPPRALYKVDPEYSEEARTAKIAGTVLLSMVVGTDGAAHFITVERGVGSGLDEKAIEAVRQWHFQPGEKEGEPVQVMVNIEVNFRLN